MILVANTLLMLLLWMHLDFVTGIWEKDSICISGGCKKQIFRYLWHSSSQRESVSIVLLDAKAGALDKTYLSRK